MGSDSLVGQEFFVNYPVKIARAAPKGRIIALSDVHGCDDLFASLMDKIDLQPEDTLVIVGDLIERGKQSLKALRRAMALNERENTYVLMGNMDAHKHWQIMSDAEETDQGLFSNRRYYGASLFYDMCQALGLPLEAAADVKKAKPAVRQAFARELEFMGGRPTLLDTPCWRFVHGGIPSNDIAALEGKPNMMLKFDNAVGRVPVMEKPLVVGHYPTSLYWKGAVRVDPYWCAEKRLLCIDGGCGLRADPQLNAVILDAEIPCAFEFVKADRFPRARARDAQAWKAPTVRFCWPDNEAVIVSETSQSFRVRQTGTEIETDIPRMYMDDEKEKGIFWINDISDAELKIAPGDEIALIARAEKGWYVEKDNLRGWYAGRVELAAPSKGQDLPNLR